MKEQGKNLNLIKVKYVRCRVFHKIQDNAYNRTVVKEEKVLRW